MRVSSFLFSVYTVNLFEELVNRKVQKESNKLAAEDFEVVFERLKCDDILPQPTRPIEEGKRKVSS